MSKKIIIVGPPGAGKTTLRKIFFEGESSSKLLHYALEPTHGKESILLELQEQIGIFDLAGQENHFWLETNQKSIFMDSKLIIIVIDAAASLEENLSFVKKVLNIRNTLAKDAIVYLLVHKIDLIDGEKLKELRNDIPKVLFKENLLKISFTSIQKEYFTTTFFLFIDILRTCIQKDVAVEKVDLQFLKTTLYSLYIISENTSISEEELQFTLRISSDMFTKIISILERQNLINKYKIENSHIFKLTDNGIEYINKLLENFSSEGLNAIEQTDKIFDQISEFKPYRFLGFIISTKSGIPVVTCEAYKGFFNTFLKSNDPNISKHYDLIPMFVSALESFSDEINIKNLSGFEFKGSNIIVQTFNFELVTITLFANSNTNLKSMKNYIQEFFKKLLNSHIKIIGQLIATGNTSLAIDIEEEGQEWIEYLNKKYDALALNLEIFDMKELKELYYKLDKYLLDEANLPLKFIKKVKKLKRDLIQASLDEDYYKIREISKKVRTLANLLI